MSVTHDIETDRDRSVLATSAPEEGTILSPDETARRDAQQYAETYGIDLEQALRRLEYQDDIGALNAALTANEPGTFGGLWLEHKPAYRVIVLFTRRGARTIRPYIRGKPWADIVEVRKADVTYADLQAIQAETSHALDRLDLTVSCALDVKGNRVEVWVTDREWFKGQLRKADIRLPDHVELVTVEGHSAQAVDVCAPSSVPDIAFPRQTPVEGHRMVMQTEMIGELVLVDGCLRVNSIFGDTSYLPVWPPEFTLRAHGDEIEVLDEDRQVVAHVGEEVYMGGGEGSAESMPACVREQLPASCTGPYFIVGDGVRPNLRHDSELFTLDVISTTARSLFLLHKKPALDEWAQGNAPLSGKLVLYDRCPRIQGELANYLPLWPPDHTVLVENGEVAILDGSEQAIGRVGEEVVLDGGSIPVSWESEQYRQLYYELLGDCHGPYWIVRD